MEHVGLLLAGVVCAAIGGELFVRGVEGIARWGRVSAGIIGATFATSSPELSVSVTSALAGTPQIALGEARHGMALLSCLGGLVFLVASGKLIVAGATGIALAYGIDAFGTRTSDGADCQAARA